jgi:hypothetical protein
MQVPHKVAVQLGMHIIPDYLPELRGRMYTLAKTFGPDAIPKEGGDNWLSDFGTNDINENADKNAAERGSDKGKFKIAGEANVPAANAAGGITNN